MNFALTAEQKKFREEVHVFLKREVPLEHQLLYGIDTDEQHEFALNLSKKLAQRGWLTIGWPKEYGGGGLSQIEQAILNEEMGYMRVPRAGNTGLNLVGPSLMRFGTEEQRRQYLPPIANMEVEYCQGFSEPNVGSDLASLELRATRDGDEYVINGTKTFTSNAFRTSYIYMLARTDPNAPKHHGISLFIADLNTPGITLRPLPYINGTLAAITHFEQARIPATCLLGEENRGWYHAMTVLDLERSGIERYAGVRRIFDDFVEFCRTTAYNGRLLWGNPIVRYRLAETRVSMEVWRLLCWKIAWLQSTGATPNAETSVAFLYGTDERFRFAQTAMQILGPYGSLLHNSKWAPMMGNIEGLYIESLHMHGAGTTEIHRNIIAQRGLKMPK
jgi:alkylation response protein AidB-like acyl-CoA dehydrogenase